MPGGRNSDGAEGDATPPEPEGDDHDGDEEEEEGKAPLGERLKNALVKPPPPDTGPSPVAPPRTVEELEYDVKHADNRERAIGLIAAPLAGGIGILVVTVLASNALNHHQSVTEFRWLQLELVVLSILILVTALLRKRFFLGLTLALYGLSVFNLHYWEFGIPFVLAGAWMLLRAYRAQRDLKEAQAGTQATGGAQGSARPRPNKRYTPPTAKPKKSPPPGSDEQKAG